MNITRDVIRDLLPAYLSGEASADTRALIEEVAARDPDIARLVAAAHDERTDVMPQNIPLPPNLEHDIVNRTRAVLRRRSWTLALAIVLTVLPMTLTFDNGGIRFLLMRDEPGSRLLWLGAAWFWFDYVRQTRRLHTKLPV
jgi:predicted anti-sigma-YlaC factor YlaD